VSHDGDRPKRTFAELDRMRREGGRRDDAPRGHVARVRQEKARRGALEEADSLFATDRGGPEGDRLAEAMRDAHGTPDLAAACRAYRDEIGTLPRSAELLSLFLDTGEEELVVAALEALLDLQNAGGIEVSGRLKSQVRVLSQDFNSAIADVAEELLEGL